MKTNKETNYAWEIKDANGVQCCGGSSPTESGAWWCARFNAQFFKEKVSITVQEVEWEYPA